MQHIFQMNSHIDMPVDIATTIVTISMYFYVNEKNYELIVRYLCNIDKTYRYSQHVSKSFMLYFIL